MGKGREVRLDVRIEGISFSVQYVENGHAKTCSPIMILLERQDERIVEELRGPFLVVHSLPDYRGSQRGVVVFQPEGGMYYDRPEDKPSCMGEWIASALLQMVKRSFEGLGVRSVRLTRGEGKK